MYHLNFRECAFYIARKLKFVIIIMILAGFVSAGYTAYKTKKNWNNMKSDVEYSEKIHNDLESAYNEKVGALTDRMGVVDQLIAEQEYVLNNTNIYSFNSENFYRSSVVIRFDFSKEAVYDEEGNLISEAVPNELPKAFLNVYNPTLDNVIDWDKLSEISGVSSEYIKKFVSRWSNVETDLANVVCWADTEEKSMAMLKSIEDDINAKLVDELTPYGSFKIIFMAENVRCDSCGIITDLYEEQMEKINGLLEENQKYVDELATIEAPDYPIIVMPTPTKVAISLVKHFVFGVAIGAVLCAACLYALFYLDGRVHSENQLSFYSNSLGYTFISEKGKKLSKFSKLIANWENRNVLYSQPEAFSRLIENISNYEEDISKVMITGNFSSSELESIKATLNENKVANISFGVEGDILENKVAFFNLKKYDAVVFVEDLDKSSIDMLNKKINQVTVANKKIVGCMIKR